MTSPKGLLVCAPRLEYFLFGWKFEVKIVIVANHPSGGLPQNLK
jgi:hypothetical protein